MSAFTVTIDAEQVLDLAGRLDKVSGERLTRALVSVVNDVRARFDTKARRAMNAGINLSDQYVSSKMSVEAATQAPSTTITTAGPGRAGRQGLTILGHYNPRAVKGGVLVEPTRGSSKLLQRRTFLMRLKRGTAAGDQFGVFERTGKDRPGKRAWKHLYGVSPYSLFRFQATQGENEIQADLARSALNALDGLIAP